MDLFIRISQFLLSLSILVLLHEFGHYLTARAFKTRVEKFYLFFNPWFSLFKFKRGDTEYGIGWLPLGGYVKISGMIDESMDKEAMKLPPQPWEFRSKPTWQRLIIMLGGVIVNFLLALVIYVFVLFTWGEEYLPTQNATNGIWADSIAMSIGLENGDHILSVDNKPIEKFHEIVPTIVLNQAKTLQVQRDSQRLEITIPESLVARLIKKPSFFEVRFPFVIEDFGSSSPAKHAGLQKGDSLVTVNSEQAVFYDQVREKLLQYKGKEVPVGFFRNGQLMSLPVKISEEGKLGVMPYRYTRFYETKHLDYGFFAAFPAGIKKGLKTSSDYLKQFPLIFSKKTKGYESLGGFGTIGSLFPVVWDWEIFWSMTAFLSIILAIMNVLPIPALDGGHVLFLLYEIITGRKPGEKFLEYAQMAGMILLLALIIYANLNDVLRWLHK
jgi:regulator of sigma E protease